MLFPECFLSRLNYGQQPVVSIALGLEGGRCTAPSKLAARLGEKGDICRVDRPVKRKTEAERGELLYKTPQEPEPRVPALLPWQPQPTATLHPHNENGEISI